MQTQGLLFFPYLSGINVFLCLMTNVLKIIVLYIQFPGGSDGKASACNVGDPASIPGSGRSHGEGNGNPLQYSCLENSMDGGAWWATVHGVAQSRTWLSDFTLNLNTWDFECFNCFRFKHISSFYLLFSHSVMFDFFIVPRDCSLPSSSVHGISEAKILEWVWVAMPSSRGSSQLRDWTCVSYISCIGRQVLYH